MMGVYWGTRRVLTELNVVIRESDTFTVLELIITNT